MTLKRRVSHSKSQSDSSKKVKHDQHENLESNPRSKSKKFNENQSSSVLNSVEVDFPRGGGSHLTAVEVKQAGHEGKTDADQIFISNPKPVKDTASSKRKRSLLDAPAHQRIKSTNLSASQSTTSQNARRIEHLSHRRLTSGLKLAGLIIEIRPLELIVALPSQLVGHVPITEISSYYTHQLQESTEQDDEDTDSEDDQSNSDKAEDYQRVKSGGLQGLNEIFKVGQWIRCMVINTTSGTPDLAHRVSPLVRAAHRVTLTIDPARLNGDLEKKDLSPNMTLDGTVKSIEDNGYVVDLCVPINSSQQASSSAPQTVTTFVLFSDAIKVPQTHLHHRERWQIGQIVRCRIDKVPKSGSTCTVFLDPSGIASSLLTTAINIDCILPLHLVTCLITAVVPDEGLNVEFLGYYKGTIDFFNLGVGIAGPKLEDRFKAGQKIRARVLWHTRSSSPRGLAEDDDVDVLGEKTFSLSLLDHCVNMVTPGLPPLLLNDTPNGLPNESIEHLMRFNIGYTFQSTRVYDVVEDWGLYVECLNGENGDPIINSNSVDSDNSNQQRVIGFIHISAIRDTHLPSILDQGSGPYKLGTMHKAKVVGISPIDGMLQLSLQPSVVEQPYIRPQDVAVGEIVTAEVTRLCPSALFLSIFGGLDCVVWPDHYSDVKLQHPEKKFQAGMKLKARVLYVNSNKHRIALTLRKSLLDPTFSPITSYATAQPGMVTDALITRVKAKHLEIEFFGQTRGVIPISEAAEKYSESLSDFKAGRVVKAQILSVDPLARKILASIRRALDTEASRLLESCNVGDAVFATVKTIGDDHTILTLRRRLGKRNKMGSEIPIPGLISLSILAWRRKVTIDQLKEQLHVGDELDDLVITAKDNQKNLIILGYAKGSKKQKQDLEPERLLFNSSAFEVGDLVTGTVLDVHAKNLLMFLKKDGSENACVGQGFLSIEKLASRRQIFSQELRAQLTKGDRIENLIVTQKVTDTRGILILDFRPTTSSHQHKLHLKENMSVVGTVSAIHDKNVMLSLRSAKCDETCGLVLGLISKRVLAGHWNTTDNKLETKLSLGLEIPKLAVKKIDSDKGLVILGFEHRPQSQPTRYFPDTSSTQDVITSPDQLIDGTIVEVLIGDKAAEGVRAQPVKLKYPGWSFLIDFPDLHDDYDKSPESVKKGEKKSCAVVKVDRQTSKVYLTLRASRLNRGVTKSPSEVLDRPIVSIKDLKKGDKIRGFIQRICEKAGLLVRIGTNFSAKVKISELYDKDIPNWIEKFKVGQVVSGVIITPVKASRGIQLSLRENPFGPKVSDPRKLVLEKLQEGQIVGTTIRKIEKYGMFLAIDDFAISGLCHVSQLSDDDGADPNWAKKYREGMRLQAALIKVDSTAKRISFSIKPSIVGEQELGSGDDEDESDDVEEEEDVEKDESVDMIVTSKSANQPLALQIQAPCLALPGGFNWNSTVQTKFTDDQDSDSESESEESNDEDTHHTSTPVTGQKKPASEPEHTHSSNIQSGSVATSIADLERQLLGSPNSSLLWIQLMSCHIQQADLNEARETVKRALNGIHYREEAEKLNVWIAWLNLENAYGTEEQMTKVFGEASKANDTKTVWLKMAEIYTESGKIEKANELYAKLVKKFSESSKAWSLYARFCLTNNQQAQTLELLARSLKSLPKHKHVKTITKFAQYEFKHGEIERGRTLFEGLIASYPKRTDLWNVYIDLERTRLDRVRPLFGRMLALKLNPKKSKFVFKKWLGIEKEFGDEASQNKVLEQARAYVQTAQSITTKDEAADEQDD